MIITDLEELHQKCEAVKPEEVNELIKLLETELEKSATLGRSGIGLAGNQIGINKQIAIVRISEQYRVNLINCQITKTYNEFIFPEEGCLSFPGISKNTKRFQEIKVENNLVYPHSFVATGLFAVCIQHELDHMNGITFHSREFIASPKQKPNDLCLCGSRKKYKKCCYLKG